MGYYCEIMVIMEYFSALFINYIDMSAGYFYSLQADNKNKVNGSRFLQRLLLAGILLVSMSAKASPTPTLTFANGSPQYDTICANGSVNLDSMLAVFDLPGSTETYTITAGPFNGTVNPMPAFATADGTGFAITSGVTYTPGTGYSGTDFVTITVSNGSSTANMTINFMVNPQPSVSLTNPNLAVCAGVTSATISYTNLLNAGPDTVHFNTPSGTGIPWTVPVGITSVNFDVQGARGGRDNATTSHNPGAGGRVQGILSVTEGEVLNMFIGGAGGDAGLTGATGGINGGGNTSFFIFGSGGAGGGASDIRVLGTALTNRVVVAGGGGGTGWDLPGALAGGVGGDSTGGSSADNRVGGFAGGGTQSTGGAGATYTIYAPGGDGSLGTGGDGSIDGTSGGGGGGYYGGGGGVWTGGGGGSSFTDATQTSSVTMTPGYDTSNGQIAVSYQIPGTYTIVWDASAHTDGFRDTTITLSATSAPFQVTIPLLTSTVSAVYTGTLTVNSATCSSQGYPITVTVNPIPVQSPISNQAVCNGNATTDILTIPSTYTWVNSYPAIGLPANGSGHISSFTTVNPSDTAIVATITVTPTALGCTGTPVTFTITDNPYPVLSSTNAPLPICDATTFNYNPTSNTPLTVFTWSRATVYGISNAAISGAGNPNEILIDTINIPVPVTYQDTLNYAGCVNVQSVTVQVNPHPVLTTTLNPAPVCSSTSFSYSPVASAAGTSITWSRAAMTGISKAAASDSGNINETLIDTTAAPVTVIYTDTLTYSTCVYTQNISVTVNPTPMLSTPLIGSSTCDGVAFNYTPGSNTTGTVYAWSRDAITGISNGTGSGPGSINEVLHDTTANPVVVTYIYSLAANGCENIQNITDTIKPTPRLSSTLSPDSICSNTLFSYYATSATAGTTYIWERDTIAGISTPTMTGTTNPISELLVNTTHNIIPVTYAYYLSAAGCVDTQGIAVNVNPTPVLLSTTTPDAICDNTLFSYSPLGATPGSSFTWTRAYVPGIDNFPSSGSGDISEVLNNSTYVNVNTTYTYIVTANGCSFPQEVFLTVHPNPTLSSDSVETLCSSGELIYYPASYTPTTAFTWTRANVTGVTPATGNGTGVIDEVLTSSLTTPTDVVYVYTLTAYGCTNTQLVTVTLNAAPPIPLGITTFPSSTMCDNTMYQNFGTSTAPEAGFEYNWIAAGATVWAMGAGNQYCLINFNTPGTATIYLVVNNVSTNCIANNPYIVNVGTSYNSSPEVIYVNGQFICKSATAEHYQWGYDDATTLDSTIIAGENNQNYYNPNPNPGYYYWVMTSQGDCLQKSYYKTPPSTTGIVNVSEDEAAIKIYPNPATETINVDIETTGSGTFRIEVLNMLGQSVNSVTTKDHNTKINVAGMPAGIYLVDCYRDGVKTATAKFIKN